MKDLGLQPTSKTSSSLSDEDVFLEDGNLRASRLAPFLRASRLFFAPRAFFSRLAPFLRAFFRTSRLFFAPRAFFSRLAPFFRASRLFFAPFFKDLAPFLRASRLFFAPHAFFRAFFLAETNAGFSGEIKQFSKTIKHVSTFNGWLIRS